MTWRIYIQLFLIALLLFAAEASVLAASNGDVAVSVTVLSDNTCTFSPPGTATLAFGNLDPTNPIPVAASDELEFHCGGKDKFVTFFISSGNGLHFSGGSKRMLNFSDPTAYIPYALTLSPETATIPKNLNPKPILTITGQINGADYRYASAGDYLDEVTLSINP